MKKILQKYLAAQFIPPFLLCTAFFVTFLLVFQLFKIVKLVINKGVSITLILELIGYSAVSFLPLALPLSILFAVVFAINKISSDSEYMAMRSFGLSRRQLYAPFFWPILMVAMVTFALNYSIIPSSKLELKKGLTILGSKGLLADIQEGSFFTEIPYITIFAEKVKNKGKTMEDVFIQLRKGPLDQIILAKSGELIKGEDTKYGSTSIEFLLRDGSISKVYSNNLGNAEKILFKEYSFPLVNNELIAPDFMDKDSTKSIRELYKVIKAGDTKGENGQESKNFIESKIEFWSRLNSPLICILFGLIGFSMGGHRGRGEKSHTVGLSLIILVVYYAVYFLGVSMAQSRVLPAELAVFLPTIFLSGVGAFFYKKLEWVA